jgi:hypothetical protein
MTATNAGKKGATANAVPKNQKFFASFFQKRRPSYFLVYLLKFICARQHFSNIILPFIAEQDRYPPQSWHFRLSRPRALGPLHQTSINLGYVP